MNANKQTEDSVAPARHNGAWRSWLPTRGNAVFVLFVAAALLFYVHTAGAMPGAAPVTASTNVIPYQGRLADSGGNALNGSYSMTFKLYNVVSGGSSLWTENWSGGNSVHVTAGLFDVLLGSLAPIPASVYAANDSLWLGLTVGTDAEMTPRVQLGSVPFAGKAQVMPSHSISTTMLMDSSVTLSKLAAYPVIYDSGQSVGSNSQSAVPIPMATITITVGYTATVMLVAVGDAQMTAPGWIYLGLDRNGNEIQGLSPDAPTANIRQALSMTAAEHIGPGTYVYDARIAPVGSAITLTWEHARLTAIVVASP